MAVKNFRTPIRPIFWLSTVVAAYPVKKYSRIYSWATVILSFASVGILFLDEYLDEKKDGNVSKNKTSSFVTTPAPADTMEYFVGGGGAPMARAIWQWMENLQNLEDAILCFILLFGYQSYRNTDIHDVLDTIRRGHDQILKLGLTPKYRNWRGIFLVLISLLHAYLVYLSIFSIDKTYFLFTVKKIIATVLPRFISHIYIVQFFCLMELVQDQVCKCDAYTLLHREGFSPYPSTISLLLILFS